MKAFRAITAVLLVLAPALAAQAAEIFSPGLPARGSQFQVCSIVNISGTTRTVTTQIFDSTGAIVYSAVPQALAPGQAGGVSVPATVVGMYCKFAVEGNVNHYRAAISVLDPVTDTIVVALPAE